MTNAQIIFNESMRLMNDGIIGTTGRQLTATFVNEKGVEETKLINEPEPIHTFQTWKSLGRQVKRGQHAIACIVIWKHAVKTVEHEDADPEEIERMFMKKAFFFTAGQTEPIK